LNRFTIEKEIFINASLNLVFDMLTNSKEIIKYFPLQEVISDWKIGSTVLYRGAVGPNKFTDYGIIEIMSRPYEYKYSYWSDNHGTERKPENYLSISYTLSKVEGGTLLKLKQSNLRSKEMFQVMNDNVWDFLLNNLKKHVE